MWPPLLRAARLSLWRTELPFEWERPVACRAWATLGLRRPTHRARPASAPPNLAVASGLLEGRRGALQGA